LVDGLLNRSRDLVFFVFFYEVMLDPTGMPTLRRPFDYQPVKLARPATQQEEYSHFFQDSSTYPERRKEGSPSRITRPSYHEPFPPRSSPTMQQTPSFSLPKIGSSRPLSPTKERKMIFPPVSNEAPSSFTVTEEPKDNRLSEKSNSLNFRRSLSPSKPLPLPTTLDVPAAPPSSPVSSPRRSHSYEAFSDYGYSSPPNQVSFVPASLKPVRSSPLSTPEPTLFIPSLSVTVAPQVPLQLNKNQVLPRIPSSMNRSDPGVPNINHHNHDNSMTNNFDLESATLISDSGEGMPR